MIFQWGGNLQTFSFGNGHFKELEVYKPWLSSLAAKEMHV